MRSCVQPHCCGQLGGRLFTATDENNDFVVIVVHKLADLIRALLFENPPFKNNIVLEWVEAALGLGLGDGVVFLGEDLFEALGPAHNFTIWPIWAIQFRHFVVVSSKDMTGSV